MKKKKKKKKKKEKKKDGGKNHDKSTSFAYIRIERIARTLN
jgi:hypothetical protein